MSVRILGGSAKGRALRVPESARPSGARIRKSLFDLLSARKPAGSFLDMHGGSGAIGLEAASRGYRVILCEQDARAARTLEQAARDLGLKVTVRRGDALTLIEQLPPQDIVFADPPYAQDIPALTQKVLSSPAMGKGTLFIVQHPSQLRLDPPLGYAAERRAYGSNVLTLITVHAQAATLSGA